MDKVALKDFLRIFLVIFTLYVWWSLYVGRVHLPPRYPGRNTTIERSTIPLAFWVVWTVYFALWVFAAVKTVPYIL